MNQVVVYLALILTGACLGSFAGATVWRLRARQLLFDKKNKEPYDKQEFKRLEKLTKASVLHDRSQCLSCGYTLKWYDLIPIVSWLSLKGRCRSCRKRIGWFEPAMEIGVALFFVLSYALWPGGIHNGLEIAHFILWLVAGVVMAVSFAYDVKWSLLPDVATIVLAAIGLAIVGVSAAEAQDLTGTVLTAIASVGILGGLYGGLYAVSRGRWVGFGDVKLGVALGLLLVDWQLALVALFMANFIGTLIVLPLLASRKVERNAHIPFGPLLIAGAVVAWFVGWPILEWYLLLLGV